MYLRDPVQNIDFTLVDGFPVWSTVYMGLSSRVHFAHSHIFTGFLKPAEKNPFKS